MQKTKSGFTIVELLIAIVVIAILAAISITAYSGIQTRAQASRIVSELQATEKAFNSYRVTSGATSWWIDSSPQLLGTGNPPISSIIAAQPEFRDFLQSAPSNEGFETAGSWIYDNDGDTYNGCSISTAGVNIAIANSTNTSLMQAIDTMMDDGNLSCGKVRNEGSWFLYAISNSS